MHEIFRLFTFRKNCKQKHSKKAKAKMSQGKIEFVSGFNDLNYNKCCCCSFIIEEGDGFNQIKPAQQEIFSLLFNKFEVIFSY